MAGPIPKPPSPHDLIGDHWPEISELGVASVAAAFVKSGAAAAHAEQKTYTDGNAYLNLLPEGFEQQVNAAFKVGGMASDLSSWFAKCGSDFGTAAGDLGTAKMLIASTTMVAEAALAACELEIESLQMMPSFNAEEKAHRIQLLRDQIKKITDEAKQDIKALYDGIHVPTTPAAPGLQPLVHQPSSCPEMRYGKMSPVSGDSTDNGGKGGGTTSALGNGQGEKSASATENGGSGQGTKPEPSMPPTQGAKPGSATSSQGGNGGAATQGGKAASGVPGSPLAGSAGGATNPGSSGLSSAMSSMGGGMPSAGGLSSGLGSGSGLTGGLGNAGGLTGGLGNSGGMASGLGSGGGASASPAGFSPAQQFVSGAAQGFSQSAPVTGASAASAAQPFSPPPGSTVRSAPLAPAMPAEPAVSSGSPQQVVSSPVQPSAPVAGGGVGGVAPLAPPPAAGVPNTATPVAPAAPSAPAAASPVAGSGGGPVSGPPPGLMNFGAKSAALRTLQLGSQATGEGLRSTPEFMEAMSRVAALNDSKRPGTEFMPGGWSAAVYGSGMSTQFVIAERHGLSWIPAGVYLPPDVTVAHLDERVPADIRVRWRGMEPSALVLSQYAKAIGEQPRIVVARSYHAGLPGWFGRGVVLAADESAWEIVPNPLHSHAEGRRHRLEVAAPEHWRWVISLPDSEVPGEIRSLAQWVVEHHNSQLTELPGAAADAELRAMVVEQIGRPGAGEIVNVVLAKMRDLASRSFGPPDYNSPHWRAHTMSEMALRGWEALYFALGPPSRSVFADMQYAALMAVLPVLPPQAATATAQ